MNDSQNSTVDSPGIVKDRQIWLLAALAIVSIFIFQFCYDKAFPAASLDLSKSRADIQQIAAVWAAKVGYNPSNPLHKEEIVATTFTEKADDKAFLEQELGQEQANQLMRQTIPVWLWKSRFCREHQFEQCFISMTPEGQFNGFIHEFRNDFALPSLSRDDAEKLARNFLSQIVGISVDGVDGALSKYTLIRDETKAQINRQDYIFVWEDQTVSLKGAYLDIEVHVSGDRVTFMDKYLHVPQDWLRKYVSMRAYNQQLFNVAQFFWYALLSVTTFVFLWATTHHKIRWKFTILASLAFMLTMFVDMLNSTETAVFTYLCQTDFQTFLMQYWLTSLGNSLMWFVAALITIGASEFLYRSYFPAKMAAENWLTIRGLGQPEVLKNLLTGHLGACIYAAWVIVYYILGQKVGFWTPLQVQNAGVYSGFIPAIGGVHVGVMASAHEELLYRVVAFVTFSTLLRRVSVFKDKAVLVFWIANFLQAACWGFMHSTYPQQPAYARGLELMFNGMLFGFLIQNVGLLSCMVAHYLVDVVIVLRPMLGSGQMALIVPTLLACVPFSLLMCLSLALRKKQSSDAVSLSNQHLTYSLVPAAKVQDEEYKPFQYKKLTSGSRLVLCVLAVACIIGSIIFRHGNMIGEPSRVRINRDQAISFGRQAMAARKLDISNYLVSAQLFNKTMLPLAQYEMQYIFEYTNAIKAAELAERTKFGYIWNVRFFKPGSTREYVLHLDGHGKETSLDIIDIETAPGARLDLAKAKDLAGRYIEEHAPQLVPANFASVSTFKRANRTDYQLGYISPQLKVGDAPFKTLIDVVGDQISTCNAAWLVPDRWRDERDRKDLIEQLSAVAHVIWPIVAGAFAAFWAIWVIRKGVLSWRLPVFIGLGIGVCTLVGVLNTLPCVLQLMPNTITLERFFLDQISLALRLIGIETAKNILIAVLAFAAFRLVSPDVALADICKLTFLRQSDPQKREQQKQLWIDALLAAYWIATFRWFIFTLSVTFALLVSPNVTEAALGFILPNINSYVPGLDVLIEVITKGWAEVATAAILTGFYCKYVRNIPVLILVLVLGSMLFCLDAPYPDVVDYVLNIGRNVILGVAIYVFIAKLAKRNILAYILSGAFVTVLFKIPLYLVHSPRVGFFELVASFLALILPVVVTVYLCLTGRPKSENL